MTENDLQLWIWIKIKMKIKEGYRLQVGRSGKRKAKSGKRKGVAGGGLDAGPASLQGLESVRWEVL